MGINLIWVRLFLGFSESVKNCILKKLRHACWKCFSLSFLPPNVCHIWWFFKVLPHVLRYTTPTLKNHLIWQKWKKNIPSSSISPKYWVVAEAGITQNPSFQDCNLPILQNEFKKLVKHDIFKKSMKLCS